MAARFMTNSAGKRLESVPSLALTFGMGLTFTFLVVGVERYRVPTIPGPPKRISRTLYSAHALLNLVCHPCPTHLTKCTVYKDAIL